VLQAVAPHLGAAFQLARWLTRSESDAADVVQEAWLRAHKFADGFSGGNARGWFLAVVRNTCWSWLQRNRQPAPPPPPDDPPAQAPTPEAELLRKIDGAALKSAIEGLSPEFREAFVLRELEGLSYKEIADACDIPMGTVMSRLSRARAELRRRLSSEVRR
jgi:RNA polymerase sigma-70 factor (ECF subfamily)